MKPKYDKWITEDGLLRITGWARDGLTDEQIAQNMGIAPGTFYKWQNEHSEIREALKEGKAPVDIEIENKLLEKARAGDMTAILFWLKNRRPDKWRDRRDKEETTDKTILVKLDDAIKDFCK